MAKILPSIVVIFTIQCLTCSSNALEDNLASKNDYSPKDLAEVTSTSSKNSSSGRIIRPSASSKEEEKEELKRSDGRYTGSEDQELLLFDEQFSLFDIKKFFRYFTSFLYAVDESNDESLKQVANNVILKMQNLDNVPDKSIDDNQFQNSETSGNNMKIQSQNLASTDILDNGEIENSPTNDSSNRPSNDENAQNSPHKDSFNNKQPKENSKQETQNSIDEDFTDKSKSNMKTKTQNRVNINNQDNEKMKLSSNNNASDKQSSDRNAQKSSDNDSSNNKEAMENPRHETQNSNDEDSTNNSESKMKTENKYPDKSNTLNKSATEKEIQNFSTNDNLNKPSSNEKMQNSSNNNPSNSQQQTKNLEDNQQNSMNKDNFNKSVQDKKMQNPSNNNNNNEPKLIASKSNKPKEDLIEPAFKDYDECRADEVTLDDNTTKYIPEEKVEKYEDNDREEEDEDDTDENDMEETETENDYVTGDTDIKGNSVKENDVEDNTESDMNGNDDNENKNNFDGDENKPDTGNQNSQPAVIVQEKADDIDNTLPKFLIQAIQDQQNYSKTHPRKNQIDNNENVTPGSIKSHNITNKENISPKFQLSSNEFMDDYINNRQGQNSQKGNEQASNREAFHPNGNDPINKRNILANPILSNMIKKDNMSLNSDPPVKEIIKDQNMPFHQSQNTEDNFWSEKDALPFPIVNEDRKGSSHNQDLLYETFPQNVPYISTSVDEPVFPTQETIKNEGVTPQKLIPFQQTPSFTDLRDTFDTPQNDYNTFTQPAILVFQDTIPTVKTFHSDIPATNDYRPRLTSSFQTYPNKLLQTEGSLNDQHKNYNFQDMKTPPINNENNQQFEQNQPTVLQKGMFSNTQYILGQDTPDKLGKTTHFTNYKPEIPENVPSVNTLESNTETFSSHMISDVFQPNASFNQIHNQDSSRTDTEKHMDKTMSQDQFDTIKPQTQANNAQTLSTQNQSEKHPLPDNFPGGQMLFPHNDKSLQQNEMNNRTLPDKSKMSSNKLPVQDENENTEFLLNQNSTKNSKEVPGHIFSITEDNLQVEPEYQDSLSVFPENVAPKSQFPQAKARSSKPLINERQKNPTFDQFEDQDEDVLSSDSDSNKNEIENDYLSENNYNSEHKMNEDQDQDDDDDDDDENQDEDEEEDEDDYDEDEDDYDEDEDDDDEVDDDYISEENYDNDDNANENEDVDEDKNEEDEEDVDKDDYTTENKYDNHETEISRSIQNPETTTVINKRTYDSTTVSPNFVNKVKSDQKNPSITQSPTPQDNIIPEDAKSQSMANEENPSSNFELSRDGFHDKSDPLGENPTKENEMANLSDGMLNDATMQITQNPIHNDKDEFTQSPEISKSESAPNQGGSFDTILEYIYKFPDNPLFKGIRDENN